MKIIVGLGNPGDKYTDTRHNVGYRAIAALAAAYNIDTTVYELNALMARGKIAGEKIILAQPCSYMNNSGKVIKLLVDYYHICLDDLLIIYDDMDLPTAKIRIKRNGSSGGHNGIKSIINYLETKKFPRLRIGIDAPPPGVKVYDYVLGQFSSREEELIEKGLEEVINAVATILSEGYESAMNKFN